MSKYLDRFVLLFYQIYVHYSGCLGERFDIRPYRCFTQVAKHDFSSLYRGIHTVKFDIDSSTISSSVSILGVDVSLSNYVIVFPALSRNVVGIKHLVGWFSSTFIH